MQKRLCPWRCHGSIASAGGVGGLVPPQKKMKTGHFTTIFIVLALGEWKHIKCGAFRSAHADIFFSERLVTMQEVNFAVLAGCKPLELLPKLGLVASFVVKSKPDFKALRKFFKENGFYVKEQFETLLSFLNIDIEDEKHVKCDDFLRGLLTIVDPVDRQRHLFKHLLDKNPILMKFIMDAIAERLYSTNELYRYLTSYIYQGKYVTLLNFKAWLDWLYASDHIRVVGIRWGLSDLGKEASEGELKLIDMDELLEEEGEGDDDDDDDDDDYDDDYDDDDDMPESDDDDDDDKSGNGDDDAKSGDDDDDGEAVVAEKPADSAPDVAESRREAVAETRHEAVAESHRAAVTEAAVGAARVPQGRVEAVAPISTTHVEVVVQPIVPKADDMPLELVRGALAAADNEEIEDDEGEFGSAPTVRIAQLRPDESLVAQNLHAVQAWWRTRPGGRLLSASDYGFTKADFDEDPVYALFCLSALAMQLFRYGGRLNTTKGGQSYAMLKQMGFYSNLIRSTQSVDDIVIGLLDGGMSQRAEDLGNLHYLLVIRHELAKLGEAGVKSLLETPQMADVVTGLWEHIGRFHLTYEIIWIARELAAMGVLSCDDAEIIGVVPLAKVRETAFRLGFIETPYAVDFAHLVEISRRLTKYFGKHEAFEAPLVYFVPKRDLRYDTSEPEYFTRDQLGID